MTGSDRIYLFFVKMVLLTIDQVKKKVPKNVFVCVCMIDMISGSLEKDNGWKTGSVELPLHPTLPHAPNPPPPHYRLTAGPLNVALSCRRCHLN